MPFDPYPAYLRRPVPFAVLRFILSPYLPPGSSALGTRGSDIGASRPGQLLVRKCAMTDRLCHGSLLTDGQKKRTPQAESRAYPELPGNTVSCALPGPFVPVSEDTTDGRAGLRRLPDETWVYPGHGGDTTLGAERPHLAEWRARGW